MAVRLRVDRLSCQSSGRCLQAAPDLFSFDADRLAVAPAGPVGLPLDAALAIARGCPALAIEVLGEDGAPIEL